MFVDSMDRGNSFIKKAFRQDKVDPGTFSFMEPGWWALHAATIAAVYMLGQGVSKSSRNSHRFDPEA
ncbi:MAG: hypothetical protein ABFD08_01690 [Syntrophomonas sp.]